MKEIPDFKDKANIIQPCYLFLLIMSHLYKHNIKRIRFNSMNKNQTSTTKFVPSTASTSTSRIIGHIPKKTYHRPARTLVSKSASHAYTFCTTKHTYVPNSKIICYACHKVGHKAIQCNRIKRTIHVINKVKQIWIPKETHLTNLNGSKVAWVPKVNP